MVLGGIKYTRRSTIGVRVPDHAVVRALLAELDDGAAPRVLQAARHFARRRKQEGKTPGHAFLDDAKLPVIELRISPQLGQVAAYQRQVVLVVDLAQVADADRSLRVADATSQRIAGIGRIGHDAAITYDRRRPLYQAALRIHRMDREVLGQMPRPPPGRPAIVRYIICEYSNAWLYSRRKGEPPANPLSLRGRRSRSERFRGRRGAVYFPAWNQQTDPPARGRARRADLHPPGQASYRLDRRRRSHRRHRAPCIAGAQQPQACRRGVQGGRCWHAGHRDDAYPGALRPAACAQALRR